MQSCICCVVAVVVTASCSSAALADTLYVDDNAPVGGDGASWSTAYRFMQDALYDAAPSGSGIDEIRVAQGVYTPDRSDHGHVTPGDRDASFQLIDGVALLGGYGGITNPDPDERDPDQFVTTLSGDLAGDDGANFQNYDENSYSVVAAIEVGPDALLEGFTIASGSADDPDSSTLDWSRGGGMWLFKAYPTVTHCRFRNNSAGLGGGMYNREGSSPTIQFCEFRDNRATGANGGGGLYYLETPSASVIDCSFVNNTAPTGLGGGLHFLTGGSIRIENCLFNDNEAEGGGGINIGNDRHDPPTLSATIINCRFVENKGTVFAGGGIFGADVLYFESCEFISNSAFAVAACAATHGENAKQRTSTYNNCRFVGNVTETAGASLTDSGVSTVVNCVIADNSATLACAGICLGGDSSIINSTIVSNDGIGIEISGEKGNQFSILNSIVRSNAGPEIEVHAGVNLIVQNCNVEGGWPGLGNMDADPLFVQPGTWNYRLGTGSPCIDQGNNILLPVDAYDLDGDGDTSEPLPIDLAGEPRVQNGRVDIGAYEGAFDVLPPATMSADFDPDEPTILVVGSGNPVWDQSVVVTAWNRSSQDNGVIIVTDLRDQGMRFAGDQPLLAIETDVPAGQLQVNATVPVTLADLNGQDPLGVSLTIRDPLTGDWLLAPALNAQNSPGYAEPIGDRYEVQGSAPAVPSYEFGDYGVFWNPDAQRGFIWANTDRPGDYSIRLQMCPGDGAPYGGDHAIDIFDLYGVLDHWNEDHRWFDTDGNQFIDVHDVIHILENWGACD